MGQSIFVASCLAVLTSFAGAASPFLRVRLETEVTSLKRQADIHARVISPFVVEDGVLVPAGSLLLGRAESENRGRLQLTFHTLRVGTVDHAIQAQVAEVDNAREKVSSDGTVHALDRLRKRPGKVEALLLLAAHAHPATLALVEGGKITLRTVERPSVHYPVGTELSVVFEVPPSLAAQPVPAMPLPPDKLVSTVLQLPQRTTTLRNEVPADWINLVFAGSREDVMNAFASAGWRSADRLSASADLKVFLAVAAHHAYQSAPVSQLVWGKRGPDLVFQKQTNTVAKRHHIRIWQTDETWDGQPLWIAAATHDTGIEFSASSKTFTHRIDPEIDVERSKVADDLTFTGAVRRRHVVARPAVPRQSRNASGDTVVTDGAIVILDLSS